MMHLLRPRVLLLRASAALTLILALATTSSVVDAIEQYQQQQQHGAADDVVDTMLREQYPANYDNSTMHIVFSNGCNQKNRALFATVLQYSATRVGQRGPITQIISGCSAAEQQAILQEPRFYYDYRVHFTPDYSQHPLPHIDDTYNAYNKPFGVQHYLQHANPPVQHPLMALTDGDILLLKPLEANTGRNVTKYYKGTRDPATVTDAVVNGVALAQDWTQIISSGLWGNKFGAGKLESMCANKRCGNVSEADGLEYFAATGPPYILTTHDMKQMIDDYCQFVVETRKVSKEWMAEMFGYGIAAANHNIKHTILTNMAPTHPYLNGNEYWSFLADDSSKTNPCADPFEVVLPADPPVGVHYFHYYMQGADGRQFHKGAIPSDILKCDHAMLQVPPASEYDDVFTRYKDHAPAYMAQKRVEVWLECTLIKVVNEALMALKTATCGTTGLNSFQSVVMMYETPK